MSNPRTQRKEKYEGGRSRPTILMTEADFRDLIENYGGVCLACGETTDSGVEPDAEGYDCPSCDLAMVYGAEQCLLMGKIEFHE